MDGTVDLASPTRFQAQLRASFPPNFHAGLKLLSSTKAGAQIPVATAYLTAPAAHNSHSWVVFLGLQLFGLAPKQELRTPDLPRGRGNLGAP
jgi:hypothetical protein